MSGSAFALAGLGGFNAHGAGFLTAATQAAIVPELITATSGQIIVLAHWLNGEDLKALLLNNTFGHGPLAQLMVSLSGDPGIFRPALQEQLKRWWTPAEPGENPWQALFDRALPAQIYVPTRTQADYQFIADMFNQHATIDGRDIGIVFNAYDLATGEAVLFGNDRARTLWPSSKAIPLASSDAAMALRPITAAAVKSSLWLSLYGFDHLPEPHLIDGAYHRSCLVAELHEFDRVFVARPMPNGWRRRPPGNWFEVQDWQTEMWFSAGYKAEADALHQINGLVAQKSLGPPYRVVDLIEVAPQAPAGYFNYFIERASVFEDARRQAAAAFAQGAMT